MELVELNFRIQGFQETHAVLQSLMRRHRQLAAVMDTSDGICNQYSNPVDIAADKTEKDICINEWD
jgi:hypothetical protein